MKRRFGGEGTGHDNERVLRHIAKATVNPAITHGIAEHVGSLQVGRLADCALWQPALCGVRPELVLKAGVPAWGASGDGNATTLLAEPVRVGPQLGALGGAPDRLSLAFVCEAGLDAELPTARERAVVRGCRDIGAGRHGAQHAPRRDPRRPAHARGDARRRARHGAARRRRAAQHAATCSAERALRCA